MSDQTRPAFNVCVFCGSNAGRSSAYPDAAQALGRALAEAGFGVVYGGGSIGLMGIVAEACLAAGGHVEGVIPSGLFAREICHDRLSQLHVVDSMHTRKATMARLSNVFVSLPGGFGTLEELFEVTTWSQLGIHNKPVYLFNVANYYDPLLTFLQQAVDEGFISQAHGTRLRAFRDLKGLMEALQNPSEEPPVEPWLTLKEI